MRVRRQHTQNTTNNCVKLNARQFCLVFFILCYVFFFRYFLFFAVSWRCLSVFDCFCFFTYFFLPEEFKCILQYLVHRFAVEINHKNCIFGYFSIFSLLCISFIYLYLFLVRLNKFVPSLLSWIDRWFFFISIWICFDHHNTNGQYFYGFLLSSGSPGYVVVCSKWCWMK